MAKRVLVSLVLLFGLLWLIVACDAPNPQPPGLTPIPTLAPAATPALAQALQSAPAPAPATAPSGAPSAGTTVTSTTTTEAALGAPIFAMHCAACHGANGQGIGEAPNLRNNTFVSPTNARFVQTISNGRPGTEMPAWLQVNGGPLIEAEVASVVAYLQTLQNVSPLPISPAPPLPTAIPANAPKVRPSNPGNAGPAATLTGDGERGRAVFGKYCAACHGPQGIQGAPNPGTNAGFVPSLNPIHPTLASADAKEFAANLSVFIEHGSTPAAVAGRNPWIVMPSFGDGKLLSAEQMADVIAYIIRLNRR